MNDMICPEHVSFAYPKEEGLSDRLAIDDLSLSVAAGEFVAVLGHNGSGKSTLAKLLTGVIRPGAGRILVDGMDVADENLLYEIRKTCGMVFQNPDNQLVATVVEEDVAFAPENMGVPPPEIRRRVDEALQTVGMTEFKTQAPHLLSGGQKQRVAIAGILAMGPRCIVFDEPTSMLDPLSRREVMETIVRLNREMGVTILLITHHMDEAARAGRCVILSSGRLAMDGPPEEIFTRVEELRSLGLAPPQTVSLLYELQKEGLSPSLSAVGVDACADELYRLLQNPVKE